MDSLFLNPFIFSEYAKRVIIKFSISSTFVVPTSKILSTTRQTSQILVSWIQLLFLVIDTSYKMESFVERIQWSQSATF